MRLRFTGLFVLYVMFSIVTSSCAAPVNNRPEVLNKQVLRFRWSADLVPGTPNFKVPGFYEENDRFSPVETSSAGFDTDKRRVFVGAAVGGLYCKDIGSGETVWRFDLDDPVGSTPLYDSARKRVYFGADDGVLYALHARSGRLLWKMETGAELRRKIWKREDTLFVANADNTVLAIDPQEGQVIWRYRKPPVEGFSSAGYSDLAFFKNNIIAGFSDGTVASIDSQTGMVNWMADLAAEAVANAEGDELQLTDVDATPVVEGNFVIAASVSGGVYGLDVVSGTIKWSRPDLNMVTGMAALDERVYVVRSGNRGMSGLNPQNGHTYVKTEFGMGIKQDPVPYDDLLLISDSESGMYIVASTGDVLQVLDMDGGFFARPSEYAGYMLILGNWSTLYSFAIN